MGQYSRPSSKICGSCAQWVLPEGDNDADGTDCPDNGSDARHSDATGANLAWLADALPRLELG